MLDKNIAIQFDGVGKQYRLGLVGTGSLQHDLNRWWQTTILRREDPYLKIGEVNDRSTKGHSDYVWALKDISFKVEQGDVVGIIGKNGAGKSTLLKLLSHITAPTVGDIRYRGRIASLLEVGTGFHPEMTARQNIYMNGSIMGMTRHEIDRKLDEIVDFAGIERYLDTPVKRFSSGMTVRLGFAVAAFLEPEILVVDEVLAVGDAEFQKKAIGKMKDVSSQGGRTVLFVSHNMASIRMLCDKGIVLENGQIIYNGDVDNAVSYYINDKKNSGVKLIDGIKYRDDSLKVTQFLVNDQELNEIVISPDNNTIKIVVDGVLNREQHIELEGRLYDPYGAQVAFFSPGHFNATSNNYEQGKLHIEYILEFPTNLTKGDYCMTFDITHPNVCYFANFLTPLKVHSNGFTAPNGRTFDYSECGAFILDLKNK